MAVPVRGIKVIHVIERRRRSVPGPFPVQRTSNRRAFPRWEAPFDVRYGIGKEMWDGKSIEIGEGGISFRCEKPLPIESEVNLEYRLHEGEAGRWVKVKAVVRHIKGDAMGVEFLNLRMAERLRIVDFVSAKK